MLLKMVVWGFYALSKSVSYAPRRLTVLLDDATKDIADNNYKALFRGEQARPLHLYGDGKRPTGQDKTEYPYL